MTISETMKDHMNAVRDVTGVSGLLNMAMATDALKNFNGFKQIKEAINANGFVDNGVYFSTGVYVSGKPGLVDNDDDIILINLTPDDTYTVQVFLTKDNYYVRSLIKNKWSSWNKLGGVTKLPLFAFLKGGVRYAA